MTADPLAGIITALSGKQIPGGCEFCDAYQTAACDEPGMYRVTVHHDDWCPLLRRHVP